MARSTASRAMLASAGRQSLSTPPHSQNIGVEGSYMDAGSRGGLSGGDSRCGSSSRATDEDQSGRETKRAFLMGEHLDSASQKSAKGKIPAQLTLPFLEKLFSHLEPSWRQQGEEWKCFVPVPIFAADPSYPLEIPSSPFDYSLGYSSPKACPCFCVMPMVFIAAYLSVLKGLCWAAAVW